MPVNMTCPDCQGTGKIVLLTSVEPCMKCAGTGVDVDSLDPMDNPFLTNEGLKGYRDRIAEAFRIPAELLKPQETSRAIAEREVAQFEQNVSDALRSRS